MAKNNEYEKVSNQIIDMLVDSTLKKHEIKLEEKQLDPETKKELKKLVKDLQDSVRSLSKKTQAE